jgi:hypothetical protein
MSYLPWYYRYISFIYYSTNHKCTQPCYFPLLLKLAAQKEKMDWNSSTRSSRLRIAPVAVPVVLWSLSLFRFIESHLSLQRHYLCNNYTLYSWHLIIYEHFWPYVWNNWSWVIIQWVLGFGIKPGMTASRRVAPNGLWQTRRLWCAPQSHHEQVEVLHQGFRRPIALQCSISIV